jgi:mono/diheme cytochrome c family protein
MNPSHVSDLDAIGSELHACANGRRPCAETLIGGGPQIGEKDASRVRFIGFQADFAEVLCSAQHLNRQSGQATSPAQIEKEREVMRCKWFLCGLAAAVPAIWLLAGALGAIRGQDKAAALSAPAPNRLYTQYCISCHSADGRGNGMRNAMPTIPDFTSRQWQDSVTDVQLKVSILEGKGTLMPGYADRLSAEQANELTLYTRSFAPAARVGSAK